MTVDSHAHTTFSIDGKASMEEMCRSAALKGIDAICFTEHCDLNPDDASRGFFDYEAFSDEIKRNQDRFSGRLLVLKGLEFSEPHLYRAELERYAALDFDFILGSVHMIGPHWLGEEAWTASTPLERVYELYYLETVKACESGLFDSLAHVDLPKRYLAGRREPAALIAEAMRALVANGISLEVNTSPLRKGVAEPCPSGSILDLYARAGGAFLTTGSDAHLAEDVAAGFDAIPDRSDLRRCYYRGRKRIVPE